jgi:hypothetical protein
MLPSEYGATVIRDVARGTFATNTGTWTSTGVFFVDTQAITYPGDSSNVVITQPCTIAVSFVFYAAYHDFNVLYNTNSSTDRIGLNIHKSDMSLDIARMGVQDNYSPPNVVVFGSPYTFTVVALNSSNIIGYLNGRYLWSPPAWQIVANGTIAVFGNDSSLSYSSGCTISTIAIWSNRALTAAEVLAHYNDPYMWLRAGRSVFYSIPSGAIRVPWHLFTPVAGGA